MRASFALIALLSLAACGTEGVRISRPPTAFAGFATEVGVGEMAILDGTRSTDPDGDRLGYRWHLVSRPAESIAAIEDTAEPLARLVPDREGPYLINLTVSDGDYSHGDLLTLDAVAQTATTSGDLAIELEPPTCNVQLDRALESACGVSNRRVLVDPSMLVYPMAIMEAVAIEWTFIRLPPGTVRDDLSVETPRGALGELTFVPSRPGEYWVSGRLIGPSASSAPAIATVGLFEDGVAQRPRPRIDAPSRAPLGAIVLLDSRDSFVATASASRTWRLLSDPSDGADALTDMATGCMFDLCRRLIPSAAGTYLISLSIPGGATAVHALEVTEP